MDTSKKGAVKQVQVRIIFLKVGDIDTVKECFNAEFLIQAKWREPTLDGQNEKPSDIKWDKYWSPNLYIENVLGDVKETVNQTVSFHDGQAIVCLRKRVKGTFHESLELEEFPFDTQDITVSVMSEWTADEVELVEDPDDVSTVNVNSFVDQQEWSLHDHVLVRHFPVKKILETSDVMYPLIAFTCHATRKFGFFFWNIFCIMFFITTLTFTTFAVDYKLPQNRLQLTFILILTAMAFKNAANSSLPRISYLTYMDKYVLSCIVVMCIVCVWHAIVGAALVQSEVPALTSFWADKWVLVAMAIFYVLMQIFVIVFILVKFCKHRNDAANQHKRLVDLPRVAPRAGNAVGVQQSAREKSAFINI